MISELTGFREYPREIVSKAPVRINDIGGWTDTWFSGHGRVLNLAASPGVETRIRVLPNPQEEARRVRILVRDFDDTLEIDPEAPDLRVHPLLQAAVAAVPIPRSIRLEVRLNSAVPPGISVGTSAAVCVSLLGGLTRLHEEMPEPEGISSLAQRVETEKLGWQSGIQDQICAAMGGACYIDMPEYPHARTEKLRIQYSIWEELDSRLLVVYLGRSHNSSALHEQVIAALDKGEGGTQAVLADLRRLPAQARSSLLGGDLDAYGEAMKRNTASQAALHPELVGLEAREVIDMARRCGACGWKVNGAGGRGGSLTLLVGPEPGARKEMRTVLEAMGKGIRILPLRLSDSGLTIQSG